MKHRVISRFVGVLSAAGAVVSAASLLIILAKTLEPSELTITILSVTAGVLAGVWSMYIVRAAKPLKSAPRIFLSYSHEDADTARIIANALRDGGGRVWLDTERLKPGDAIRPSIEKAIDDSDTFVVLLSRSHSPNLTFEVGLARGRGLRVIPVLLREAPVPTDLEGIRYVDLRERTERGLEELVRAAT